VDFSETKTKLHMKSILLLAVTAVWKIFRNCQVISHVFIVGYSK